jgi:hypothetical protein
MPKKKINSLLSDNGAIPAETSFSRDIFELVNKARARQFYPVYSENQIGQTVFSQFNPPIWGVDNPPI